MQNYTLREYAKIYKAEDFPKSQNSADEVFLPTFAFHSVRNFIDTKSGEHIFRTGRRKGCEYLQAQQYVGIVETPDGTTLEILPKIYFGKEEIDDEGMKAVRRSFLQMLRSLRHTPFRQLGEAYLQAAKLPLLEVFIAAFTEATLLLVQNGLQENYTLREANEPYLRGKLIFSDHLKTNLGKPYNFYIAKDDFRKDIAPNRLLRTAIDFLAQRTKSYENRNHLQQLQSFFAAVPRSQNLSTDYQKAEAENRLFPQYKSPLTWAKIFLRDQSFSHVSGSTKGLSLLFPTARIFEEYVGQQFQRYSETHQISLQDRSHHLLQTNAGKDKFALRPDIVAENEEEILIFDTKWKLIDPHLPDFGITQADLYQMFSYGEKYATTGKSVKLYLIYPQNPDFKTNLPAFHFHEERLPLFVSPYDFSKSEKANVESLLYIS